MLPHISYEFKKERSVTVFGVIMSSYSEHFCCLNACGKMPVVCHVRASANANACSPVPVVHCCRAEWTSSFDWC